MQSQYAVWLSDELWLDFTVSTLNIAFLNLFILR